MPLNAVLWGRLLSCVPIVNRRVRRLPAAAQVDNLPHTSPNRGAALK